MRLYQQPTLAIGNSTFKRTIIGGTITKTSSADNTMPATIRRHSQTLLTGCKRQNI